ncbi:Piso0_001241 [Millerozyma farinosa CBS 7064]|uniref:20S-pre-rRNA D-site endonuclease NOB1 n=1 Tax=Pichia sorbitophila (strain ATCC MYA-4447 / BCRC 22081 / CBS 7064 / NBRC 10061 / NRRL Y-12695) TaxID=559304 RepID=G8YMM5_PICSO|nr:Piso0_001241 [Millerozyma farinosa CBS 7064]
MPDQIASDGKIGIDSLVLDAGPLITQTASSLQQYAKTFYTTPGVHGELKDEHSRRQLTLWDDKLVIRQPKKEYIQKVSRFAKLTGDYAVLSLNDIHIIALAYELECEKNHGDWRLRSFPGEKIDYQSRKVQAFGLPIQKKESEEKAMEPKTDGEKEKIDTTDDETVANKECQNDSGETKSTNNTQNISEREALEEKVVNQQASEQGITGTKKNKPRRRGGKKQRMKRELREESNEEGEVAGVAKEETSKEDASVPVSQEKPEKSQNQAVNVGILEQEYDDEDDDGEWITPETLQDELIKDSAEQVEEKSDDNTNTLFIKAVLATGDFACQNVAMQIGINLINIMTGKQIKRVRNYMYRCHACFRLTPIPKNGIPKYFCPFCGGNTLLRCAVSVDSKTGKITPHLKANFQWIRRGEKYSLPSPLSKNQQKLQGKAGYQHNKQGRNILDEGPLILREDQIEYEKAIKNYEWQRKQQEKVLSDWVGGGSADNFISPFTSKTFRPSDIKVGRGRYANSTRRRK